jgi:hypothetical protein
VFADELLVRREVHAVDAVVADVAVQPSNLRSEDVQRVERADGHLANLLVREQSGGRHVALDDVLVHRCGAYYAAGLE